MSSGFRDKLYWRPTGRGEQWHCFKRLGRGGYISLCGRHEIKRSGGQECRRPIPLARCGRCDRAEMKRRGWSESGPARNKVGVAE